MLPASRAKLTISGLCLLNPLDISSQLSNFQVHFDLFHHSPWVKCHHHKEHCPNIICNIEMEELPVPGCC